MYTKPSNANVANLLRSITLAVLFGSKKLDDSPENPNYNLIKRPVAYLSAIFSCIKHLCGIANPI